MSDRSETKPGADESQLDRRVGRPRPKLGTAVAAWSLFGALWIAGLALGHQIKAAGHDDFSGAWAVLYGGLWMLLCVEMRKAALALWTAEDEFKPNGRGTDLSRDAPQDAQRGAKRTGPALMNCRGMLERCLPAWVRLSALLGVWPRSEKD